MLFSQNYEIGYDISHVMNKRCHMSTQIPLLPPSDPITASLSLPAVRMVRGVVNYLIHWVFWPFVPVILSAEVSFLPALRENSGRTGRIRAQRTILGLRAA